MTSPAAGAVRVVDAALEVAVVPSFSRVGYTVRSKLGGWSATHQLDGTGRRFVVTGGNSGLGYATAVGLLRAGAKVVISVRSSAKGESTLEHLRSELGDDAAGRASFDVLDLADLASVVRFATARRDDGQALHGIVHNAGAMFPTRATTIDGLERTYQTHVVAPFRLTAELLPCLAAGDRAQVVTVTSGGMYAERLDTARIDSPSGYRPSSAYARAKRAQVVLTAEWARRSAASGVDFHVAHPGWALTPGVEASLPRFRRLTGPLLRTPDQGADTIVYLALGAGSDEQSGQLWHDRRVRSRHKLPWTPTGRDTAAALWARVCRDAGVHPDIAAAG